MSDRALIVLRGGLLSIVVDRGRFGFLGNGVSVGGPLDALAFSIADVLAGNAAGTAAIEVSLGDFAVRFECDARFALAGADCGADLDGARVDAWGSYGARAGSTLTLRRPRVGARGYFAVAGGVDVPLVMGSRDTNLAAAFGGYEGRALRGGDRVSIGGAALRTFEHGARLRCKPPQWDFARDAFAQDVMPLRFLPGGEFALLPPRARDVFWSSVFSIGAQSNRMGARLSCVQTFAFERPELPSHAVFPGVVQLPPSGEPIALLADAQATGGYPRLGSIVEADLWKLAQRPAGATVRFVRSSLQEAGEARAEVAEYLSGVEASLQ